MMKKILTANIVICWGNYPSTQEAGAGGYYVLGQRNDTVRLNPKNQKQKKES